MSATINLGRVVGYSAYEVAVQNGFVGTEEEWLESLKGEQAVSPFKGWYESANALPANPVVGDYAYVKGANASDPAAIYECTTAGTWTDSGMKADTSNVQTFASGEEVNEVHIVNDFTTGGAHDVLSAEKGVELHQLVSNFFVPTIEDGFFVVDNNLNIGVKVDSDGLQAINLGLEYDIIN